MRGRAAARVRRRRRQGAGGVVGARGGRRCRVFWCSVGDEQVWQVPFQPHYYAFSHQACAEKDCYDEKVFVIRDCTDFLRKYGSTLHPSLVCKMTVEESDLACICCILTDHDEETISAEKLVLLARLEGKVLEAGTKCGSYTIPPLPATPPPRAKSMRA